jgi:hypothetical protein
MNTDDSLPTHVDEIDALRLHNSKLKFDAAVNIALAAAAEAEAARVEWDKRLSEAEEKYGFNRSNECVDFTTRMILRAPHGD